MRFPFFPIPAEGETIYSGFCRCAERAGLAQRHIVLELTGQRNIHSLHGALPGYLKRLASSLPIGHPWTNLDRSIRLHTAMPYYTYFDSPTRRSQAVQLLIDGDFAHEVSIALGLTHYQCGAAPKHPRFCLECMKADEAALGFSYFRREHQLPAVVVCWRHGCILSHGCRTCGPYPIPQRGLSMPGHCLCDGEQSLLPVLEELPGDPDILKWLASESAYMVSGDGTRCPCVRDELRRQALNFGLCRGSQPVYADIATALEQRFDLNILNWLGYPPWTNGRPSAWIRGLLHTKKKRRKPTIVFLLFVGLFRSSVAEFEQSSSVSEDASPDKKTVGISEWRANLPRLLAKHRFSLQSVGLRIGVSQYIVATEARRQGIRVPVPRGLVAKLGLEKIESIRSDLRAGLPKAEVKKKHRVNWREIQRIEFDTPGVHDLWKSAVAHRIRDEHRQRVIDLKAADPSASRTALAERSPGTHRYMLQHDSEWFDGALPACTTQLELPLWDLQECRDGAQSSIPGNTGGAFPDWETQLQHLLAAHSFKVSEVASRIGVSQKRIVARALKQHIRIPLSDYVLRRLGQDKIESIRSELCAGTPKRQLARSNGVGAWTIRLIEVDTPGVGEVWKSATTKKMLNVHRQRVVDMVGSDPKASRSMLRQRAPGTYQYMLEQDSEWFEQSLPQLPRGRGSGPRRKHFDRLQFDSELAERAIHIIRNLKSTSQRPIRITKRGVLTRAGYLARYLRFSTELPKTRAVLNEHVEAMPEYRVRKIKWAIAEIGRNRQPILGDTLRRMAGLSTTLLHLYKELVLETAQQLGVSVGPQSLFARGV